MILPHPAYQDLDGDRFEPRTLRRMEGATALRTALLLLARPRRSAGEDERLLREAQVAVECLGLALASRRDPPCLAADLVLVRALAATARDHQADRLARRLWLRAAGQPGIRADLALAMAEHARLRGDRPAAGSWRALARAAVAAMPACPARDHCAGRIGALAGA